MAQRKRRKFTTELKAEAVRLCADSKRSVGGVSKKLDLTEGSLRHWIAQAATDAGQGPRSPPRSASHEAPPGEHLGRHFQTAAPNRAWVGDVTFGRRATSDSNDTVLALSALRNGGQHEPHRRLLGQRDGREFVLSTHKAELTEDRWYQTRAMEVDSVAECIDCFCNPTRRHSTIDHVSPIKFDLKAQMAARAAESTGPRKRGTFRPTIALLGAPTN